MFGVTLKIMYWLEGTSASFSNTLHTYAGAERAVNDLSQNAMLQIDGKQVGSVTRKQQKYTAPTSSVEGNHGWLAPRGDSNHID